MIVARLRNILGLSKKDASDEMILKKTEGTLLRRRVEARIALDDLIRIFLRR